MCFLSTYFVLGPVSGSGVQSSMCCDPRPPSTAPESSPVEPASNRGPERPLGSCTERLRLEAGRAGQRLSSLPQTPTLTTGKRQEAWAGHGDLGSPGAWRVVPWCLAQRRRCLYHLPGVGVLGLSAVLEGAGSWEPSDPVGHRAGRSLPGAPHQHQDVTASSQTLRLNRAKMIMWPVLLDVHWPHAD